MSGEPNQSPQLYSDLIYSWLETALDYGINEFDFWNMTPAELARAVKSKKRMEKIKAQEQASMDYILADLIGRSVGRIYASTTTLPELHQAYPNLFDSKEVEEVKAVKKAEISALRFKLFAQAHNDKLKKS